MSCNICMEPIANDIFTTSCKHNFHNKCMVPWMLTHNTCPCCRRELGTDPKPIQKKYVVKLLNKIETEDIINLVERVDDMVDYLDNDNLFEYNWKCDYSGTFYHTIKKYKYNLYLKVQIFENKTTEFIVINSFYKKKINHNPKKKDKWIYKKKYNKHINKSIFLPR